MNNTDSEYFRLVDLVLSKGRVKQNRTIVFKIVLPNRALLEMADDLDWPGNTVIQVGELDKALSTATIALASTGTVTMECAFFGVPAITLYKTSWSTYQIGRRIIQVKYLAMPNILADEALFPPGAWETRR